MNDKPRRIAINVGGGFVPGMNAVVDGRDAGGGRAWAGRWSASVTASPACSNPMIIPTAAWYPCRRSR